MYVDKLDGKIDEEFYDRKAAEWRSEQDRLLRSSGGAPGRQPDLPGRGRAAPRTRGAGLRAVRKQEPREQRRLLDFLLSNCTWKDNRLAVTYRQPFDLIADASRLCR